ncbi:unnamed protein product [Rotaria sp. Silwood1]|nr:unnamed protein product [Rotaria sp. Silwood1]
MSMNDGEVHLLPLIDNNDFDSSSSETEDDDSIEVLSNVDEEENKIIDMTKYSTFSSDDESEIDNNANDIILIDNHVVQCCNTNDRIQSSALDGTCLDSGSDVSDDDVNENHLSNECTTNSTSYSLPVATDVNGFNNDTKKTSKHKPRQRSIVEKLNAINTFKSNGSKHRTAVKHGCTTAQLRKWLKCENESNRHLNADVICDLRKKRVVVAIIPKGCTMYLQVLDVSVFSVFKNHYDAVVEEYIDHNGPRTFQDIGYIWSDNSPFFLRTMPGKHGCTTAQLRKWFKCENESNRHLNADVMCDLRKKRVVVAIIPRGCTMYMQVLDVSVFSVFKNHYDDVVEEYIDHNGPRSKIKLTASQSRILCTRFTWSAWLRTLKSIDFVKAFQDIGYIRSDNSPFFLRTMPGYTFDPSSADWVSSINDDNDIEDRIDIVADKASEQQHTQSLATRSKQLTLLNM